MTKSEMMTMLWEYENYRDTDLPSCARGMQEKMNVHRIHAHHNIEILMLLQGLIELRLYDLEGIDKQLTIHEGEVMVLNSNIVHSTRYIEDVQMYLAFVPPDKLMPSLRISVGKTPSKPVESDQTTHDVMKLIAENRRSGNAPLLTSLGNALMADLSPKLENYSIKLRGSNLKIDIIDYVYKNYRDPELTVQALASAFGYSERTLGDIFNANVGTSPKRYINDLRVNEAAQLLMKTDNGVEQIGYEVGFESFRTFLRAFKDKTGMTPSGYRDGGAIRK